MPTYDYECPQCGTFEVFQSITADPLKRCPTCKSKVRRLIGAGGGLLFKGSGFYITDYRSDEYKQKAKSEQKSAEPAKTEAKKDKAKKPASEGKGDKSSK